jgi:hypothetical protein
MQLQLVILSAIVASAIAAPVTIISSSESKREARPQARYPLSLAQYYLAYLQLQVANL